ncbi:lantibiotic dehydratase [Olivibacter domesticus]|uniref:Thiopeptide-type bacteriocin biosynthesis domain-containing protein n=1 Tax=Olivibacter domesticus TaxID=407022 RepID=A0A1H7SQP7_OLID1|nr:lantibiotic dehydratase [Olivibacter domesticus]SEL74911.1 thiopeptide-type bacteriocin biosynthesis domain-containing protein [Olivibacter domesticus]
MKLKILSPVICRTPLFPYTEKLENVWEELKEAIKLSSTDLYEQIKDTSYADYDKLNPKIKFACWKYFNRARYRSTPFGLFGSITPVPLGLDGDDNRLIISKEIKRHEFTDWSNKDYLLSDIDNLFAQASLFLSNSTIYTCGDQLRYISITEGTFEISGIESQPIIKSVLDFCQEQQSKDAVLDYLTNGLKLQLAVTEDLLKQLIALQLMITDIHPNIIGTDYFERMKVKPDTDSKPYLIAERKLVKGQIDPKTLKVISEAISFLKDHLPIRKNHSLENFKQQFQRKFEYREVPLLVALDPELGVGYDGLEMAPIVNPVISFLKERDQLKDAHPEISYTPLHQFILNKMVQNNEVKLEEFSIEAKTKLKNIKIPNTFSAIIQFDGKQIILKHAGGCTASALLGRFTLANDAIETYCKNIVMLEQDANPEVLFVDISYQAEKNIDNVNRRKSIYDHKLAILSYVDNKHLSFNDLLVSVRQNNVFLRSKKHNKRIIPRLASAYNYTRSDLSLYRFLSDLQNQDLQTNLSLEARSIFPNLDYYPRLVYKNIIFSPSMWKVPQKFRKPHLLQEEQLVSLKIWLQDQKIPNYFKCGDADQHLYINSNTDEDLVHFLQYCKKKEHLYITEVFIKDEAILKNELQQVYLPEFILNIAHLESNYSPLPTDRIELSFHPKSLQVPGGKWLYFEIYMHSSRANDFLTKVLPDFLKKNNQQIASWFFIRYNIPSFHIRLRLKIRDNGNLSELIKVFYDHLNKDIKTGIISDVQIKPYIREIERYGIDYIEQIEWYFSFDSRRAINLLNLKHEESVLYFITIQFLKDVLSQLSLTAQDQLAYAKNIADKFVKEMHIDMLGFKKINEVYKHFQINNNIKTTKVFERSHLVTVAQAIKLLNKIERTQRINLLIDITHMHINRVFIANQRIHELIIYQYLQKHLQAKQKHSKLPI